MFRVSSSGSFKNTEKFLAKMKRADQFAILKRYGELGINALSNATPIDSGKTAEAWKYKIVKTPRSHTIVWQNDNMAGDVSVAILLQYGHGTGTGGFVQGIDFVNPSIRPIFEKLADEVWREVTNA